MKVPDSSDEKPVLDFHGKILLIRSKKELPSDFDKSKSKGSRKKINLPVTDCVVDPDYEIDVSANYEVPSSYVRYVRRVGHEADISVDYNMDMSDKEWMSTHPVLSTDKDCRRQMDTDIFEAIINILEHHTAFSRDPIPQTHADKLVAEAFGWSASLSTKILPAVYQYWLKKRATLKKPLCRPYWPQTPAADQHPHLTFRPRAAEKYRLRRQHRKNDLESFRKMKQLKAEFARAYDLLCLIIEREGLREAELNMQQEIFEQTLYDIDRSFDVSKLNTGSSKRRRPEPYAYLLSYEELLKEPEPPSAVTASLYGGIRGHAVPSSVQHKHQQAEEARRQHKRNKEMQASLRKKREGEQSLAAQQAAEQIPVVPVYHSAYEHQRALEENALQYVHINVPGPRTACRPPWPHFLSADLDRSPLHAGVTTHGYLEILRQSDDVIGASLASTSATEAGTGVDPRRMWDVYGLGASKSRIGNDMWGVASGLKVNHGSSPTGSIKTEEDGGEKDKGKYCLDDKDIKHRGESASQFRSRTLSSLLAEQFPDPGTYLDTTGDDASFRLVGTRSRGRVGRGGRLVVDRIPILSTTVRGKAQARANMGALSAAGSGRGHAGNKKGGGRMASIITAATGDDGNGVVEMVDRRCGIRHMYPTSLIHPYRPFTYKPAKQAVTTTGAGAAIAPGVAQPAAVSDDMPAQTLVTATHGVSAAPITITSAGAPLQTQAHAQAPQVKVKAPVRELVLVPPTQPPERAIVAPNYVTREIEYYACSDSEGEEAYVPALTTRRGLAIAPARDVKIGADHRALTRRRGQGCGTGSFSSPLLSTQELQYDYLVAPPTDLDSLRCSATARGMGLFQGVGAVPTEAQPFEKFHLVV